jgi:hypothetical protein
VVRPWPTAGVRGALDSVICDIFGGVKDFAAGSRDEEVLPPSLFSGATQCEALAGMKSFTTGLRDDEALVATLFGGVGGDGCVYHIDDSIPPFLGRVPIVKRRAFASGGRSVRSVL